MRRARVGGMAALAVGVMLFAAASACAEIKAGVVDIAEVTNGYDWRKDAEADLQAEQKKLNAEFETRAKALEDLRLKRDGFNKGTEDWKKLDDQLLEEGVKLRNWAGIEQIKIDRRHSEVMLDMYHEIARVVARLAQEKKLDIVFTKAFLEPPQIDVEQAASLEDLKNRIMGQRILYPTIVTDMTQEVLKVLNEEYKAKKPAPAAPAPAPAAPAPAPAPKG